MRFVCKTCDKTLENSREAARHEIKHIVDGLTNMSRSARWEIINQFCFGCGYTKGSGHAEDCDVAGNEVPPEPPVDEDAGNR